MAWSEDEDEDEVKVEVEACDCQTVGFISPRLGAGRDLGCKFLCNCNRACKGFDAAPDARLRWVRSQYHHVLCIDHRIQYCTRSIDHVNMLLVHHASTLVGKSMIDLVWPSWVETAPRIDSR